MIYLKKILPLKLLSLVFSIMLKLRSWLYSVYLSLPPLLSKLSAQLIFFCFSSVIVYMFYNRLIRERLPKDLLEPVSSLQKSFYIYAIGINILILILLLWEKYQEYVNEAYEELGIERKVNKLRFWFKLKTKLAYYSLEVQVKLSKTYLSIIYPRWQDPYHKWLIACFIRFNKLSDRVKLIYFYGILIIPKVVVAGVFLWDIFIQNELNLFYKVLGLLLIPLMFRFVTYNYNAIVYIAIRHIENELNNDPHAFRGTDEDIAQALEKLSENNFAQARSRTHEFFDRKIAAWYKRVFYSFRAFISDLEKKTEIDLYMHNMRMYSFLHDLPPIMENLDAINKDITLPLNIFLRIFYAVAWSYIYLLNDKIYI